nr:calcium-dependent protein kinase 11-like [Tanacetum cinerariifolium]
MKVKESLNVTFDETPPPPNTSPLEDDDLVEEEDIEMEKSDVLFRPKLPVFAERLSEKDIGGLKQMFKMIDADNNDTIKMKKVNRGPQKPVNFLNMRRSSRVRDKLPQASRRP